jgi:hypothetical protein
MKLKLLFIGLLLVTLPCSAYSARFVLMTPETKDQSDFQPWLYHAFKTPETVIVAVPYHKGDKKYWLVRTNRTLSDDELDLRTIIHSHNSRPLPDHIESVSKLSPYDPTEASGIGEEIGIIYVRIHRDALNNYYVVHDFPDGVDDGGDYRTYKLAAYAVDSFEAGQDRIAEYFKARRENPKIVEAHLDKLVAALNEDGGWWQNGLYAPVILPADAKAEDVLSRALQSLDESSPLKEKHRVLGVRKIMLNKKAFLAVLLDYPHGTAIFLCEHENDGSWWTRFIPFPNEEKKANKNTNEANTWSEPINGLQARLTLEEKPKVNGTRLLMPFLELRNVSDLASPMEVNCERQFLKIELVDAEGKEINGRSSLSRSGPIPILNTIILPAHSAIRISLECRNWGVPKDTAAMVATDSGAWIIDASEKGNVYLRATLTGEKSEPDHKKWKGRIQTPLIAINWK